MCPDSPHDGVGVVTPDTINEFAIIGDFGFKRVVGPFDAEKDGTLWTISVPLDSDEPAIDTLALDDGRAASIVADGEIIGGGIVETVDAPDGEDELHVVIDQYTRSNPTTN